MDRKPTSSSHANKKPSVLGGFFEGAKSGLFNSSMMMSIFAGLSYAGNALCMAIGGAATTTTLVGGVAVTTGIIPVLGFTAIAMSIAASTLFTGALGAKKAYDVTHSTPAAPVRSPSQGHTKTRSQEIELSESPSHTRSDWAERTGRSGGSRIADLLKNGSQEERSHAAAILEAREQESATSASRF